MKTKKPRTRSIQPKRAKDAPATQGMLLALRDELKSDFRGLEHHMNGRFKSLEAKLEVRFKKGETRTDILESKMDEKFRQVDVRFDNLKRELDEKFQQVDARFKAVDGRFDGIEFKLEKMSSDIHRIALLVEAQNAKNNYVLDGYAQLYDRQDRIEKRMDSLENLVTKIK